MDRHINRFVRQFYPCLRHTILVFNNVSRNKKQINKIMKTVKYKIEFFSCWHCGSGLSAGADVDALVIKDKNGKDLYPMIKERAIKKNETEKHNDMVRFEYINSFGHYCTESSEHNAEYNQYFILCKKKSSCTFSNGI